ncbi:MAG: transglycosylase domain-containing protein [Clostridiales bacterium]|nr:transglycosylase domain-containing protein [Clostridiales bacterium]
MDYSKESNRRRKSKRRQAGQKVKNKVGVIIFRVVIAVLIVGVVSVIGALAGAYVGIVEKAPQITEIMAPNTEKYPSIIYDEHGTEIQRLDAGEQREFVAFDQIPQNLKDAFVAVEDERFYSHDGIDPAGIMRAVTTMLTSDSTEGASTITQQLIKNKLGIRRNSFVTKFQEWYLALEYEKNMIEAYGTKEDAKDKILEIYLNSIGLGNGQIGVQAASNRYFNKNVSDLTLAECAVIAAITQNPTLRDPIRKPESNNLRKEHILDNMIKLGFITESERLVASEEDVYSKINAQQEKVEEGTSFYSYYTDKVVSEVKEALMKQLFKTEAEAYSLIYEGGLRITACVDLDIQKIVDDAFMNDDLFPDEYAIAVQYIVSIYNNTTGKTTNYDSMYDKALKTTMFKTNEEADAFIESIRDSLLGADDQIIAERIFKVPQPQAGMAIMDFHNGKVVAIAGGRGEKQANRALNRATDAQRQPGSVFKVLASYAPALDLGYITAGTVIVDEPFTVGNYTPKNWYTGYRGPSTVREGIRDSMNILAVKNAYNTGMTNIYNYLLNFGFTTIVEQDMGLATALGGITYGVTQEEIAAAFGAIANEGIYNKPMYFTKVLDSNGNLVLENTPESHQVLKKTTSYILTDMMKDVITSEGTGGSARFQNIKMPIAGKTGTTTATKDLVFAGYTPYYVASIYLGYDMPQTMKGAGSIHTKLWSYIMERVHQNLEYRDFERPDGIITETICNESGGLAIPGICNVLGTSRTEIFAVGTQPNEYCNVHDISSLPTPEPTASPEPTAAPDGATSTQLPADITNQNTQNGQEPTESPQIITDLPPFVPQPTEPPPAPTTIVIPVPEDEFT